MTPDAEQSGGNLIVVVSDRADADRDKVYLRLNLLVGPEYASRWVAGLQQALESLPDFPGPLSHAVDEEASILFGQEVRRALYRPPGSKRSVMAYRVLFVLSPPDEENEVTLLILRILHGAQSLTAASSEEDEE